MKAHNMFFFITTKDDIQPKKCQGKKKNFKWDTIPWNTLIPLYMAPFFLLSASGNVDENIDPTKAEIIGEIQLQASTFAFCFVSTLLKTEVSFLSFLIFVSLISFLSANA